MIGLTELNTTQAPQGKQDKNETRGKKAIQCNKFQNCCLTSTQKIIKGFETHKYCVEITSKYCTGGPEFLYDPTTIKS
jgi:hypothetical protein